MKRLCPSHCTLTQLLLQFSNLTFLDNPLYQAVITCNQYYQQEQSQYNPMTSIINANMERYTSQLGSEPPVKYHPFIRSEEACYASTSKALDVAAGTKAHLHIMHLTTAHELGLFTNGPLRYPLTM